MRTATGVLLFAYIYNFENYKYMRTATGVLLFAYAKIFLYNFVLILKKLDVVTLCTTLYLYLKS